MFLKNAFKIITEIIFSRVHYRDRRDTFKKEWIIYDYNTAHYTGNVWRKSQLRVRVFWGMYTRGLKISRCKYTQFFSTALHNCRTYTRMGWDSGGEWGCSSRRVYETCAHGGSANDRVNKRPVSYHRETAFYYLNGFQRATQGSRNRDVALRVGELSKKFPRASLPSRLFRDTLRVFVQIHPILSAENFSSHFFWLRTFFTRFFFLYQIAFLFNIYFKLLSGR